MKFLDKDGLVENVSVFKSLPVYTVLHGYSTGGTKTSLTDVTKDLETDVLKDYLMKIQVNGLEYVRKITEHTSDTFSFATLGEGTTASVTISKEEGGSVTLTTVETGSAVNEYKVIIVDGEGAETLETCTYADGVLIFTTATDVDEVPIPINSLSIPALIAGNEDAAAAFTIGEVVAGTLENGEYIFSGAIDDTIPEDGSAYAVFK